MGKDRHESEQMIKVGRKKLVVYGAVWGAALLIIGAVTGLQYAGTLRLEQYFAPNKPEKVDQSIIYLSLAVTALLISIFVGGWMIQALKQIRQGEKLRQ
jgi:hypothetical protein